MSRQGNCHDNAVAESFFSLLTTERIKRKIYKTRNEARAELFNYIEFYCISNVGMATTMACCQQLTKKQYYEKLAIV